MSGRVYDDDAVTDRTNNAALSPASRQRFLLQQANGKPWPIRAGPNTIGAASSNDIVIEDDDRVSRTHCTVWHDGNELLVTDHDSRNGTWVNETRIHRAFLSPGLHLRCGRTTFQLELEEPPDDTPLQRWGSIIGASPAMQRLYAVLEQLAPTNASVVIEGETGTGKEVVARSLHEASSRRREPFEVFDCSTGTAELISSDLFGHERGAFTDALYQRQGVFERATGGSLFLDELGELPIELQPKLLRAVEDRSVRRMGGGERLDIDVRLIAATHRRLESEVQAGRFREDLYHRLNVMNVVLPPLRERREDIAALSQHFLREPFNIDEHGNPRVNTVSDSAQVALLKHPWPGNVRELRNALEHGCAYASNDRIELEHLPSLISGLPVSIAPGTDLHFKSLKRASIDFFERRFIEAALRNAGGNITWAAHAVALDRSHFRTLMKRYDIQVTMVVGQDNE